MTFWTDRRGLLRGAAGFGAAATMASCGDVRTIGFDKAARSLDIANAAEPLSLDPHKASGVWENNIIGNMFVGLTTEGPDAEPGPGMALSWTTARDGLTWTFKLRDALWSDGAPVTAHDFVYGLRRILDPANLSEYASVLYSIKNAEAVNNDGAPKETLGVRALDDTTLEIALEYPAPYLPWQLKHYTAYPVPAHIVERHGDAWTRPENIVVNGPFKLTRWWSNYIVQLAYNPRFYDAENVALRALNFYPTTDPNTARRQIESRERGWAREFPSNQVEELRAELPGFVRVSPYMLTTCMWFNCTRPPFDDKRLRNAMAMALDREFIGREIYRTGEEAAYHFVPPGLANYEPGARYPWAGKPLAERRADAVRILQSAGYGPNNPFRFELAHRNSSANPRVATVVRAQWSDLAPWVRVDLAPAETQIHYANLRAKNYTVGDGGWVADFNDPKNYLFLLETRTGPQNYSGYSNPEYDRLVFAADRELDAVRRAGIIRRAEQIMLNDAPCATTVFGRSRNLVHPDLTGFADNVEDIHRARWFGFKA